MLYLLLEIWLWVVAAGLAGGAVGWWLRSIRAERQVVREAMIWQRRLDRLEASGAQDPPPSSPAGPEPNDEP